MISEIKVLSESGYISITKQSEQQKYELFDSRSGTTLWLSEDELRELRPMIEDLLQHVKKNDWI